MAKLRSKLILGALFGLGVIVALLLYTDLRHIGENLRSFPLLLFVPVLGFTLFNYALRWMKWHRYLRLVGVHAMRPIDSAALFVSGFVLALSPGKVAELLKAAILRAMTGMPVARTAPVVLAERATDGLGMMILAAMGFAGMLTSARGQQEVLERYLPAYFTVLAVLLGGIMLIQVRPLFNWLLACMERMPLIGRISHTLHELYQSSYQLLRPGPLLMAIGIGVISWAGECVAFYLILAGLGLEPGLLLLSQATFILAVSSIIGAVSGLPGGLGAAELSIVGMVQLLILARPDPGLAGTAAILVRLATLWFGAGLGLVTAILFRHRLFPDKAADLWAPDTESASAGGTTGF